MRFLHWYSTAIAPSCRYWVSYWQGLTGELIAYRSYQGSCGRISQRFRCNRFSAPFNLSTLTGEFIQARLRFSRVLASCTRARPFGWWSYAQLPGFRGRPVNGRTHSSLGAGPTESAHETFMGSRSTSGTLRARELGFPTACLARSIVAAFASLGVQILGLSGHGRIAPLGGTWR